MPKEYKTRAQLPKGVKDNLPAHAEEIYKEAYNSAYEQYDKASERRGDDSREVVAHKVAWAAVKKVYKKVGDKWVKKD